MVLKAKKLVPFAVVKMEQTHLSPGEALPWQARQHLRHHHCRELSQPFPNCHHERLDKLFNFHPLYSLFSLTLTLRHDLILFPLVVLCFDPTLRWCISWFSKIGFKSDLCKSECNSLFTITRDGLRLLSKRIDICVQSIFSVQISPGLAWRWCSWAREEGSPPPPSSRLLAHPPPLHFEVVSTKYTKYCQRQNRDQSFSQTNKEQTNSWFTNYIYGSVSAGREKGAKYV